jgi:hypothetical protein
MHIWGDGFLYFSDVEKAAEEIGVFCARWGRIGVMQTKEKYGTARVYCHFGVWGFHSLILPRYAYNQWPKWLWNLDCDIGTKILSPFNKILIPYQKWIYLLAYKKAIKKYPHIREEILNGADWHELLENL